jgi:flagellar biosynthetic protein FlhB
MAEDVEQDQRTEAPSARRLSAAREQGDVPIGRDAAPVAALGAAAITLMTVGPMLRASLSRLFGDVARSLDRTPFGDLPGLLVRPGALVLAVIAAAAAGAVVVTLAQTGGGVWSERLEPDLSRLWSGGKLSRLLSKDLLIDVGMALLKVVAIAGAAWFAVRHELEALPRMVGAEPAAALSWVFGLLATAAKPVLLVVVGIAAIDLFLVRWRFMKKMKMTKAEAKREYKEDDGDPLLRNRRKKRHREIIAGKARLEVPRADALLVNPTHIAIALRYRKDEGRAPKVTAKGKGVLAEHMRALAREHGVPIVEDIPLARLLYRKVKVGREIPAATYKAVATILAFVYRTTGRSPAQRSSAPLPRGRPPRPAAARATVTAAAVRR